MARKSKRRFQEEKGVISSQCISCAHKHSGKSTCAAFPNGIPREIITNKADHRKPYPGDNGILFQPYKKGIQGDFRPLV